METLVPEGNVQQFKRHPPYLQKKTANGFIFNSDLCVLGTVLADWTLWHYHNSAVHNVTFHASRQQTYSQVSVCDVVKSAG